MKFVTIITPCQRCTAAPATCFKLAWTLSPHTLYAAPDMFRWYAERAKSTRNDWLILPPSGYLYAYPGMMRSSDQAEFVNQTERVSRLMNTSNTVSWEFMGTWDESIAHFYPRYATADVVHGIFPVNVPYTMPIIAFGVREQYKLLGKRKSVVLFRPKEWRGVPSSQGRQGPQYRTAKQMANEITNSTPPGSVIGIYTTSDGGMNLQLLYDMVEKLGPHVKVVSPEELVAVARQRGPKD